MREAICIFKLDEDNEFYDFDDNCIIGWDNGMQTYFFYNGHWNDPKLVDTFLFS